MTFFLVQEIKFLSQFKHPNIVQYYGSELVSFLCSCYNGSLMFLMYKLNRLGFFQLQIEDRFYIYLEYVHPGSINKYVRQHFGAMTESVIRNFTRHILNGLAYLHSKDIMHRYVSAFCIIMKMILFLCFNDH